MGLKIGLVIMRRATKIEIIHKSIYSFARRLNGSAFVVGAGAVRLCAGDGDGVRVLVCLYDAPQTLIAREACAVRARRRAVPFSV